MAIATQIPAPDLDELELVAGHAAFDLINTVDPRAGDGPQIDFLTDHGTLVRWAVRAGLLDFRRAGEIEAAGVAHPRRAAAALRRAVELREALHGVVVALMDEDQPLEADLEIVRTEIRGALAHTTLDVSPEAGDKGAAALASGLEQPAEAEAVLWPIARSAMDLLTNTDLTRWRRCPGDGGICGWIVLDATRNRSRRWCDMAECGNPEKSKRQTERRRAERAVQRKEK